MGCIVLAAGVRVGFSLTAVAHGLIEINRVRLAVEFGENGGKSERNRKIKRKWRLKAKQPCVTLITGAASMQSFNQRVYKLPFFQGMERD